MHHEVFAIEQDMASIEHLLNDGFLTHDQVIDLHSQWDELKARRDDILFDMEAHGMGIEDFIDNRPDPLDLPIPIEASVHDGDDVPF